MTESQLLSVALTTVPTMTVVLIGILINNARLGDMKDMLNVRLNDMRDVLRAEMEKNHSEMLHRFGDLDSRIESLETRMTRIENSLGLNRG